MPLEELLPHDPLLLVPRLIDAVHFLGTPGDTAQGYALVWARLRPSPLTEAGQGPVFAAVARAEAQAQAAQPGVTLLWSGVNRFAAASRARIEAEIKVLNVLSVLAVLAVGAVFLRQIWKILYLFPVIACSLLGAWTASTLVFPRLHILVFVIGSLLSGVAVDYGFYIYLQPPARPDEPYAEKLRRLLKPLLASCLTTVIGFSLLLFSNLPFIRQVGFFVSAGLLCALGSAMLYFAQFRRPFLEARQFGRVGFAQGHPALRRLLRIAFFVALAIAVTAPWRTHWRDDIRELDIPNPGLLANEVKVRSLFGDGSERSLYLTYGPTVAQARERLERFLEQENPGTAAHAASLGLVFPTESDWEHLPDRLQRLDRFGVDFRAALRRHGFDPGAFLPFFSDWDELRQRPPRGDYAALYREMAGAIHGPLAQLYQVHGSLAYFITIAEGPAGDPPPPQFFTVSLNELQSLNRLFTRYRWSALRLSLIGLGLVIGSVFLIYPFRRAVRIALIPAGSCFFVLGALALAGQTLNLFHLLGAFLGLCLAHNYAIFSSDSARTGQAPPVAIRLSAASAAASFAVLACSHIPVVHALGLVVCLIVLTALVAVEWEPMLRGDPVPALPP
jgi:predicted exporter